MVAIKVPDVRAVAGNVTGGMIPTWEMREYLSTILARNIPYVYVRDTRKKGGNKEKVTGAKNNPSLPLGTPFVVGEELVNFAESIINSALELRALGYIANYGICILFYDNPVAKQALSEAGIEMIYLFTLPQLLDVAERNNTHPAELIATYREFLKDPITWNKKRGFEKLESGGTK